MVVACLVFGGDVWLSRNVLACRLEGPAFLRRTLRIGCRRAGIVIVALAACAHPHLITATLARTSSQLTRNSRGPAFATASPSPLLLAVESLPLTVCFTRHAAIDTQPKLRDSCPRTSPTTHTTYRQRPTRTYTTKKRIHEHMASSFEKSVKGGTKIKVHLRLLPQLSRHASTDYTVAPN
jgi:hypothetical protein